MLAMDRRKFVRRSAVLSCAPMIPSFLVDSYRKKMEASRAGNVLIVIQLSGGNDGLNMLVPYADDLYYHARPMLGISPSHLIAIDDHMGLNKAMEALYPMISDGEVSILNSVGYPNPNRSHFRSMDIWQTASEEGSYLSSGWIGRYLDSECPGCDKSYHAIEWGDNLSLALQGEKRSGFAMRGLSKLKRAISNEYLYDLGLNHQNSGQDNHLDFLYKTMTEVQQSAAYILARSQKNLTSASYPDHAFGLGLRQIAELILAGSDTRIYYIQLPGFDTHVHQKSRQAQLLRVYASGVAALIKDLKAHRLFGETLIMTFSEFGRRVVQNASLGTDHGAANNLLLIGGQLRKPGFFNDPPDLSSLIDGDLPHVIDFRSIYANIVEDWLKAPTDDILPQKIEKTAVI